MDLAKFAQMPPESGGAFLKFTPTDNIKIVRFLYEATPGIDENLGIPCRQKLYDPTTRKVIWDSPDGKWTLSLRVAVYTSKTEYSIMTWDRSAVFGRDYLIPLFEAAGGRIVDTVYRVTCSKAGTLDASFSFFPLKDSDTYAVVPIEQPAQPEPVQQSAPVPQAAPAPQPVQQPIPVAAQPTAPQQPAQPIAPPAPAKKQFWEL